MMAQVLSRRSQHFDWPQPDVILIDGGKSQVGAVLKTLKNQAFLPKIIGLAKKQEQLVVPDNGRLKIITPPLDSPYLILLRAIRDEAHRFSTTYHKKLRQKNMLAKLSQ